MNLWAWIGVGVIVAFLVMYILVNIFRGSGE